MNDDEQHAPTQLPYDRRVVDRELHDIRERLTDVERQQRKLAGAMYGSENGLGLQHQLTQLTDKVDQLIALDRARLPRWAVLLLWLVALAIGGVIAWASLGGAGG